MQSTHCLNCEAALAEKARFCGTCGQTAHPHRLSVGHVVHDGLHFFLHADKSIFNLVKALAVKTGRVGREFIEGKRKKYFPPLNFYLIVVGLFVLSMNTFNAFDKEAAANKKQLEAIAASIPDPVVKAKIYTIMSRQANALFFIKKYSNLISMFAVPLMSFLLYLFYCRGRYNYAEHLVANLYNYGFTALTFTFIAIPLASLVNSTFVGGIVLGAFFVFDLVYRSIYYYNFMDRRSVAAAFKAVGVVISVQIFWLIIVLALMFWYIKSGFSGLLA
jgi:hypothetical protein